MMRKAAAERCAEKPGLRKKLSLRFLSNAPFEGRAAAASVD